MHEAIKFSVFVLLLTTSQANKYDDEVEPVETEKQFILDQHKNTIEILKSEMDILLGNLMKSLNQKVTVIDLKMDALFTNLSETFNQKLTNSDSNLSEIFSNKWTTIESQMQRSLANISEAFNRKLTASDLKLNSMERSLASLTESFNRKQTASDLKLNSMESSLASLTESFNRKQTTSDSKLNSMETSLANISHTLNSKIMTSDSKLETSLATVSHSINQSLSQTKMELLSKMIWLNYQTLSVHIGVPQQGSNGNIRAIYFGRDLSERRGYRLNWMLQEPTTTSIWFSIRMNNLAPNDSLTITGVSAAGQTTQFQINSTTPARTEFTITGFVAFVSLTVNSEVFHPSLIKLWYRTSSTGVDTRRSYRREIVTKGLQDVSFPQGNTENYTNYATSAILIAPTSGREFKITLKYLDIEDCADYLKVFSLDGNSTISSSSTKPRPDPNKRWCGKVGVTSQTLGYSTAAVLFFSSDYSHVGKGYKVEIRPE